LIQTAENHCETSLFSLFDHSQLQIYLASALCILQIRSFRLENDCATYK